MRSLNLAALLLLLICSRDLGKEDEEAKELTLLELDCEDDAIWLKLTLLVGLADVKEVLEVLADADEVKEGLTDEVIEGLADGVTEGAVQRPLATHPVMRNKENIILCIRRSQHIHIHMLMPYLICTRLPSMRPPPSHAESLLLNNMHERVHLYTCNQPPATAEGTYVPDHLRARPLALTSNSSKRPPRQTRSFGS